MTVRYSIIIPTHNRAGILARCLQCICQLEPPDSDWEILTLNNNSNDSTNEVVNSYRKILPNLRYFHTKDPGLHVGRNLALQKAKGEILCYIDDDSFVSEGWLKAIERAFRDSGTVLVGGPCLPQYEIVPPTWTNRFWIDTVHGKCFGSLSLLDFGDQITQISPHYVYGCNFNIRRDVLEEIGGFHPDAMPKELIHYRGDGETSVSESLIKLGHKALYRPDAKIHHFVATYRTTTEYFRYRYYLQGISSSFAKIRMDNGIGGERLAVSNESNSFLMKVIRNTKGKIKRLVNVPSKPESEEISKLREIFKKSSQEGFRYHQEEVTKNPKLFEWVLRNNYLGENGKLP